jgi:hypothetical protein
MGRHESSYPQPERSGIAAQQLSAGDVGLQLLENSIATALGLAVLILMLAQIGGGIAGTLLAGVMFDTAPALSTTDRASGGHLVGEVVATGVLVHQLDIVREPGRDHRPRARPAAVLPDRRPHGRRRRGPSSC